MRHSELHPTTKSFHGMRINTNGDLEVWTHAPSNFISRPFLIGESRVQAMPRALWPACRDRAAGMTSARLALSSHSSHERDDRAERILRIHVGMWLRAMPVEQLPAARHLPGERGALAEVPALGRHVRTGASGSGPSIPFRSQENYSHARSPNRMSPVPYGLVPLSWSRVWCEFLCNEF